MILQFPNVHDGRSPYEVAAYQRQAQRIAEGDGVIRHLANPRTTWPALAAEMLRADRQDVPESDAAVIRAALSSVSIGTAILGMVNTSFLTGFDNLPDNTQGWTRIEPAENFLPQHSFTLLEAARLERMGRGEAAHAFFGFMASEGWAVGRYAAQLILDETDLVAAQYIGLKLRAFEELGRAAARVVPDMVFSLLLQNPTMTADNRRLFCNDHLNYGTGPGSALSDESLDAASAAIASQVAADTHGDAVHLNLNGRYLILPPELYGLALRLARHRMLDIGDSDLIVRSESRLGPAGVVDPQSNTVVTGTSTNWFLAGSESVAPSTVVGAIGGEDGKIIPRIRQFDLAGPGSPGQWGIALDVVLDVGAAALDWRPLYFATGQ